MHVRGWRHLAVAVERDGHTWCAVELAESCSERDAHTWAQTFEARYRREISIAELCADPWRFNELYTDGGVGVLLDQVEARYAERDRMKRELRR